MTDRSSPDTSPSIPPSDNEAGPSSASPFNRNFQRARGPKQARVQSGRVLPPAPAWMAKPLKPPRPKTDG
jgi:hypothetical protein